ncbi:MAG: Phosphoserine phosphatase 1 [bacterium ADurb.Bin363]|nr:MAG: Phosphoserine phosphatase 1 [bacterium ADurb.Bin363]
MNVFRGQLNVNLNENGLKQAEELGEVLQKREIKAIYSSPLKRALETANIIARKHNMEVKIHEGFNNISLGEWEGKSKETIQKNYPEFWHQWVYDTENIEIPGGEKLSQVRDRAFMTLKELIQDNRGETFIIVSHRCVLKVLLSAVLDIGGKYFWKIYLDNASYSTVKYDDEQGFSVTLLNETCHLSKKAYEEF